MNVFKKVVPGLKICKIIKFYSWLKPSQNVFRLRTVAVVSPIKSTFVSHQKPKSSKVKRSSKEDILIIHATALNGLRSRRTMSLLLLLWRLNRRLACTACLCGNPQWHHKLFQHVKTFRNFLWSCVVCACVYRCFAINHMCAWDFKDASDSCHRQPATITTFRSCRYRDVWMQINFHLRINHSVTVARRRDARLCWGVPYHLLQELVPNNCLYHRWWWCRITFFVLLLLPWMPMSEGGINLRWNEVEIIYIQLNTHSPSWSDGDLSGIRSDDGGKEVLGVSAGTHSSQVDASHGAPFN